MNKFLTFQGTQPVYLGDIDFMQNAASAALKQLAQALMDSADEPLNAILQGVIITQLDENTVQYSSGVVIINGEVLPVAGGTISAVVGNALYFHVVSTLSGERTFKDGQSHQCYDTRSAILDTNSTGGIALSSLKRFNDPASNHEYSNTGATGSMKNGKLIRKNGFWFFDVYYDVEDGSSQDIGSLSFYGLSEAHLDSIPVPHYFAVPMVIDEGENRYINWAFCSLSKSGSTAYLSFYANSTPVHTGTGRCAAMIPAF